MKTDEPTIPVGKPIDFIFFKKSGVAKLRIFFSEGDERGDEGEHFWIVLVPKKPVDFIVLHVGVVIALSGVAILISHEKHRNALREKKSEEKVAHLPLSQLGDVRILCRSFNAAIPAVVLVVAVAVVFLIGEVVFLIVADQIAQSESVVRCDEIDAAQRRAVDHFTAAKNIGKNARFSWRSFEKSPDDIAIASIPFRPMAPFGKIAELIQARCIPRFSDQFDFRKGEVLPDGV